MKLIFSFLCCFLLFEFSLQACTLCPCSECPAGSTCIDSWIDIFTVYVYCDGICMTCARYIAYPCIYCAAGTFCYIVDASGGGIDAWCLDCLGYPAFCAGSYTYGSYPNDKLLSLSSNSTVFQQLPFLNKP